MFVHCSGAISSLSRHVMRSAIPGLRTASSSSVITKGSILSSPFSTFSSALIFPRYCVPLSAFQNLSIGSESKSSLNASLDKRLFSTQKKKKKSGSKKQKERLAKKKDVSTKTAPTASNVQNEEWVNFQQSISVQGFNTGQSTAISSASRGVKSRGGSGMRRRREKEMEMIAAESVTASSNAGTGQFPALRYSDEETQRLLTEAYANLPKRTGKRGTRNLKRQKNRWAVVRKNRSIKKLEIHRAHYRRMEKRGRIVREVLSVKAGAETIRSADREYQEQVLKRWAEFMKSHVGGGEVKESQTVSSVSG